MDDILKRLHSLGVTKGMPKGELKDKPLPYSDCSAMLTVLKDTFPNGIIEENDFGKVFINRFTHPKSYIQGTIPLDAEIESNLFFDEMLGKHGIRKEDTLAMDTETSGLSMGAGSFVFMIGMGYYLKNEYIVDQLIMPDLDSEAAFIRQIEVYFSRFPVLLTYNGNGFDVPMIRNRSRACLFPDFCSGITHIDLLPIVRRFWKGKIDNCRLCTIEQLFLQLQRTEEEEPGSVAPERYRQYLAGSDASSLKGVSYHNKEDVISLTALLIYLNTVACQVLADPRKGLEYNMRPLRMSRALFSAGKSDAFALLSGTDLTVREAHSTVKMLMKSGDLETCKPLLQGLAEQGDVDSCFMLATVFKKNGEKDQAAVWLRTGLQLLTEDETVPYWSKQMMIEKFSKQLRMLGFEQ